MLDFITLNYTYVVKFVCMDSPHYDVSINPELIILIQSAELDICVPPPSPLFNFLRKWVPGVFPSLRWPPREDVVSSISLPTRFALFCLYPFPLCVRTNVFLFVFIMSQRNGLRIRFCLICFKLFCVLAIKHRA